MSKRVWVIFLILLMGFALVITACSGNGEPAVEDEGENGETGADDTVYEFSLHHQDPPTAAMGQFFDAYAQKLDEASNGRIKITVYPSATLGGPPESYNLVTTGVCDLAWGMVAMFPGQFPGTEAVSLPLLGIEDAYMGSKIVWDLYNETDLLDEEYKDVQVLFIQTNMDAVLGTSKKVTSRADLAGLNIRCSGGPVTQLVEKLGGNPMSIPITELYTSLEKNVVDGYVSDWHALDGFKLTELSSFYLDEKIQVGPFWFVMNKDKWNSLPEDIQQIFIDNSGDVALLEIEQYYNSIMDKLDGEIDATGGEVTKLSDDERAAWKAAAEETWAAWVADYAGKGIDVQPVLDEVLSRVENFSR